MDPSLLGHLVAETGNRLQKSVFLINWSFWVIQLKIKTVSADLLNSWSSETTATLCDALHHMKTTRMKLRFKLFATHCQTSNKPVTQMVVNESSRMQSLKTFWFFFSFFFLLQMITMSTLPILASSPSHWVKNIKSKLYWLLLTSTFSGLVVGVCALGSTKAEPWAKMGKKYCKLMHSRIKTAKDLILSEKKNKKKTFS